MKVLKSLLKYTGYVAFFAVALVLFFYWTLPLKEVEDYLVRKASDEYNADLSIAALSTWGVSGVQAEGVTVTPRPTVEEMEVLREAREARAAWKQAKADRAEAEAAEKKNPAAAAEEPKAPDAPAAAAPTTAKPADAGPSAGPEKPDDKKGAKKSKLGPKTAANETKPPPIPRGPQPLHLEVLRARVSPFALAAGAFEGRLEASLLGGEITAEISRNSEQIKVNASWSALDLQELRVLESALPLPMVGSVEGSVDMEIPVSDQGATRLASATGKVELKISAAQIGPGTLESEKLGAFGRFDVPNVRIAELGGRLEFEKRRATFENFEFHGKDVEGDISGYIQLANKLERWGPRAYLRFRFSDEFMEKNKDVKTAMSSIPYVKRGTARDGYTGFAVTGSITQPKWRPRKDNPYGKRRTSAKRDSDDKDKGKAATVKRGRETLGKTRADRAKARADARKAARDTARKPAGTTLRGLDRAKIGGAKPTVGTEGAAKDEDEANAEVEEPEDDTSEEEDEEPKAEGEGKVEGEGKAEGEGKVEGEGSAEGDAEDVKPEGESETE